MSFRCSSRDAFLALLVAVILGALALPSAQGADPRGSGRSIEFSAPKSDELSTNLHQLTNKKDSLKQFEEDTYSVIRSFSPVGSLDGVSQMPVPIQQPRPSISPKRLKELMDRQKDYIWMTPEQLIGADKKTEDLLGVPEYGADGIDKKTKSRMELYYEKLAKKPAEKASSYSFSNDEDRWNFSGKPSRQEDPLSGADADLPGGLKDSAQGLKKLFADDDDEKLPDPKTARANYTDIFGMNGFAAAQLKQQADLEHKKMMDEFRGLYDSTWKPATPTAMNSLQPMANPYETLYEISLPKTSPTDLAPSALNRSEQASPLTPVTAPTPPVDITAQVLGQYDLSPISPKAEPPKQTQPRVTFEFPKRPGL